MIPTHVSYVSYVPYVVNSEDLVYASYVPCVVDPDVYVPYVSYGCARRNLAILAD